MKKRVLYSFTVATILFTGCSIKNNDVKSELSCEQLKPTISMEQAIKKVAYKEGFTALVENSTDRNPKIFANNFSEIKIEAGSDIDFVINNYLDATDVKKVDIFLKTGKYELFKEIGQIEYTSELDTMTINDVISIFSRNGISIEMPSHLINKTIELTPHIPYKLDNILNIVSNKLIEQDIYANITFGNKDRKVIRFEPEPYPYAFPSEYLDVVVESLRELNIPFKRTSEYVAILGNLRQQVFAKTIIEEKTKFMNNSYVGCIKTYDGYKGVELKDGIKIPFASYNYVTLKKTGEDNNGIEQYLLTLDNSNGSKSFLLKTNRNKIIIDKPELNMKITLF